MSHVVPDVTYSPKTSPSVQTGLHRMNMCSKTGKARQWKAWVKTEEADRKRKEVRSVLNTMNLRR